MKTNRKKQLSAMLAVLLTIVILSACGSSKGPSQIIDAKAEAAGEKTASKAPDGMSAVLPGVDMQTPPSKAENVSASDMLSESNDQTNEMYEAAVELIGSSLSDLIDKIGEPESSDYSSSCLGSGDDGELIYDAFTVYTYRDGDNETIMDVIKEGESP